MKVENGNRTVQEVPPEALKGHVWPSGEECRQNPHHPDCKNRPEEPLAAENTAYVDAFCECHHFDKPMILANKTDIAWPAGWDEKRADQWRKANGLSRPA